MKIKLALLGLLCAHSFIALADDFKFGYINVDRVFSEAKPAKAIHDALTTKYGPQEKQLKAMNDNILNEQKQMQQLTAKASSFEQLSKSDQTKLKTLDEKWRKDQGQFQQQSAAFQQNLGASRNIALADLMPKINEILKNISDKKGFDLVLTSNQMVYAKAKYDLTDQVMEELNKVDATDIIKKMNNPQSAGVGMPGVVPGMAAPAGAGTQAAK